MCWGPVIIVTIASVDDFELGAMNVSPELLFSASPFQKQVRIFAAWKEVGLMMIE